MRFLGAVGLVALGMFFVQFAIYVGRIGAKLLRQKWYRRQWLRGKRASCGKGLWGEHNLYTGCQRWLGHLGNHAGPWRTENQTRSWMPQQLNSIRIYRTRYDSHPPLGHAQMTYSETPEQALDEPLWKETFPHSDHLREQL